MVSKGAKVNRHKDIVIYYTMDIGNEVIVRQRIYKTEDGSIQTPITPLLELAIIANDETRKPVKLGDFAPRRVKACFTNIGADEDQSELTVFIPYQPGDPSHNSQITEITEFTNVVAVNYEGESLITNIRRYFR